MRHAAALLIALVLVLAASAARADEATPGGPPAAYAPMPPAEPAPSRWYGWQTLTTDGASLLVAIMGGAASSSGIGYVGLGGYLLGAPVVHLAHGNPGRGAASFVLRAGLPVLGFAAGYALFHHPDRSSGDWNFSGLGEGALMALGGMGACVALDAALFARESSPDEERAPSPPPYRPTMTPQVGYVRGGALAGVGGTF